MKTIYSEEVLQVVLDFVNPTCHFFPLKISKTTQIEHGLNLQICYIQYITKIEFLKSRL